MISWRRSKTGIERLQKKKQLPDLDKYLILSISILITYSIFEFVFSTITGIQHDTLTTCVYAAFGGELFLCAWIKKLKLKRGE